MIADSLLNSDRYASLHPSFPLIFSFLKQAMVQVSGRVELDGDNVFVLFSQSRGKKRHEGILEAHRSYIDIHLCFDGLEEIGWRPVQDCDKVDKNYDKEKDFMTFLDEPASWVRFTPGSFAVFFPEDAHAPMVSDVVVTKAVVKVKVMQ